jgi:hypothetical protein
VKQDLRGRGPGEGDFLFAAGAIGVFDVTVLDSVFVDEAGDFDVVGAVFGDFEERFFVSGGLVFLPPLDGLEAFGGFTFVGTERGLGDGIELDAVAEDIFDGHHDIEVMSLGFDVEDGVLEEDFVVEGDVVEADDEIGFDELLDEGVGLVFAVDMVLAGLGGVGDTDRHAHFILVAPATDVIGGALGFEIEVDEVLHREKARGEGSG